jgi:hypothetical protein
MTVLVSEKKFCVPGGAPPESGLASSLAGLYRVGASTRWCGWVKGETVNRKESWRVVEMRMRIEDGIELN